MKPNKSTMSMLVVSLLTLVCPFSSQSSVPSLHKSQKLGTTDVVMTISSIEEMPGYSDAIKIVENLSNRFVNLKFLMFQHQKLQKPWIFINRKLTDKNCENFTLFNIGSHILMCQRDRDILVDHNLFEKMKKKHPQGPAIALTHEIFRHLLILKLNTLPGDLAQETQKIKQEAEKDLLFFNQAMFDNLMTNLDDDYIKEQFFHFSGLALITKADLEKARLLLVDSFDRLCGRTSANEIKLQVYEPNDDSVNWATWSSRYLSVFAALDQEVHADDTTLRASLELLGLEDPSNFFRSLGLKKIFSESSQRENRFEIARKVNEKLTEFTQNNLGFACELQTTRFDHGQSAGPTRTPQGGRTDGGANVNKEGVVLESALYKKVRIFSSVETIPGFDLALTAINKASTRLPNLKYLMLEKKVFNKPWIFVHHQFKIADCEKHPAFRIENRILMCQSSREIMVDSDFFERLLSESPQLLAQAVTLEILRSSLLSKLFWSKGLPPEEFAQTKIHAEKSLLFFNLILHNDQIRKNLSDQLIVSEFYNFTNDILLVNTTSDVEDGHLRMIQPIFMN